MIIIQHYQAYDFPVSTNGIIFSYRFFKRGSHTCTCILVYYTFRSCLGCLHSTAQHIINGIELNLQIVNSSTMLHLWIIYAIYYDNLINKWKQKFIYWNQCLHYEHTPAINISLSKNPWGIWLATDHSDSDTILKANVMSIQMVIMTISTFSRFLFGLVINITMCQKGNRNKIYFGRNWKAKGSLSI